MARFVRVILGSIVFAVSSPCAFGLDGVWSLTIEEVLIIDLTTHEIELATDYDPVGAEVEWIAFLNGHELVYWHQGSLKRAAYSLAPGTHGEALLDVTPARGAAFTYSLRPVSERIFRFCRGDPCIRYGSVDTRFFIECLGTMAQTYSSAFEITAAGPKTWDRQRGRIGVEE